MNLEDFLAAHGLPDHGSFHVPAFDHSCLAEVWAASNKVQNQNPVLSMVDYTVTMENGSSKIDAASACVRGSWFFGPLGESWSLQ